MREIGAPIVLYNNDDPTGSRDGARFNTLLKAIPYYDLCVVRRQINIEEYKKLDAKRVLFTLLSYDEEIHEPFAALEEIPESLRSEVAFIGTWMRHEQRDEFLIELIDKGIPVSIWGDRWQKSPHFLKLKPFYKGTALRGRDYVAGIQGSKICIGLLSKGNRDLHTRRSVEISYCGGLFCAERTSEHQEMYKEGVEAVFWSDANECASICKKLLENDEYRQRIKTAGMKRVREMKVGNEDMCNRVLSLLGF